VLSFSVFVKLHHRSAASPRPASSLRNLCSLCDSALGLSSLLSASFMSPKSFPLNSFADPHLLTPVTSILYRKHGGRGRRLSVPTSNLQGSNLFTCHSSKDGPVSPLTATLTDLPASVANKRLTAWLSPLDATLTKNRGWRVLWPLLVVPPYWYVAPTYPLCLPLLRKLPGVYPKFPFWKGVYSQLSNVQPSNLQTILSSHCGPRTLVQQSAKAREFFTTRGNNSAPPGV